MGFYKAALKLAAVLPDTLTNWDLVTTVSKANDNNNNNNNDVTLIVFICAT